MKIIKFALVASLALNIAFISTLFYRHFRYHPRPHPPRALPKVEVIIDNDLQLNQDQKEEIKKIFREFELKMMEYKRNILDQRISIIEAMNDTDEFNVQTIEEKTRALNNLESELNLLFVSTLIRVGSYLDPQQRINFLYKLSQHWFFIDKRDKKPNMDTTHNSSQGGPHE